VENFRLAEQFLILNQNYAGDRIQGNRHYQEDDFGFDDDSKSDDFLMVLADGMGGHKGGAIASNCIIRGFISHYETKGRVAKRLRKALLQANHQLALKAQSQPELRGMGCTLVSVAIHDKQLEWISVGDSPLWLYRAGKLHRLNADHSMKPFLQEQVQRGVLNPEDVLMHPDRNMLLSAVTGTRIDLVDQSSIELYSGDRVLLASDGIFTLSDMEISNILGKPLPAKKLVNELLDAVEKKGKQTQDNTTALVVQIPNELNSATKSQSQWRWQTGILFFLFFWSLILWAYVHFRLIDLPELIAVTFETPVEVSAQKPIASTAPP
jgi:serine/threonine protein phosphatase PrpC